MHGKTPPLTGAQRYRQALRKAHLMRQRSIRRYEQGLEPFIAGGNDRECLIAELDRAYEAGLKDGRAQAVGVRHRSDLRPGFGMAVDYPQAPRGER